MGRVANGGIDYDALYGRAVEELRRGGERGVGLQLICALLQREVPHYDWFGFYFAVPGESLLALGPFEGEPTEHVRIPFGSGICGLAADRRETIVVDDVTTRSNYLACSIKVRSEIVVPIFRAGEVIGEIDIDSHRRDAFTDRDRAFLERLAVAVEPHIHPIPPA